MDENIPKNTVNPSSLVDLKAELFRKQEEFKAQKLQKATFIKGRVTEKKPNIWSKKNSGVLQRAERDLEAKAEEENSLENSRKALAAKAKLYEKMTQGNEIPEEDGSKIFLVDFQKKAIDTIIERRDEQRWAEANTGQSTSGQSNNDVMVEDRPANPDEEWVEFTDSLGRARTCMRKDLPELKRRDKDLNRTSAEVGEKPDLLSEDMRRELEREEWERQEQGALDTPTGPVHYADVQHNEVRDHGVGYYQFSQEEDSRAAEMERLANLRQQTIDQRSKREMLKEKRKAMLESRLAKVKQRKLGREGGGVFAQAALKEEPKAEEKTEGVGEKVEDMTSTAVEAKVESLLQTVRNAEARTPAVREWDIGKTEYLHLQWENRKKNLEDERNPEFAPPTALYSMETARCDKQGVRGGRGAPGRGQRLQAPEPPPVKVYTREEYEEQCRTSAAVRPSTTVSTHTDRTGHTEPVVQDVQDIPLPPSHPTTGNFPLASSDKNVENSGQQAPGGQAPQFVRQVFDKTVPPPGFDPSQVPHGFDPSKCQPGFDPSQASYGFDPSQASYGFDPSQCQPGFDPSQAKHGFDPSQCQPGFEPSQAKHGFDPSQCQPSFDPSQCQPGFDPSQPPPGYNVMTRNPFQAPATPSTQSVRLTASHPESSTSELPVPQSSVPTPAPVQKPAVIVPKLHIMDTRYIKNKEAPVLASLTTPDEAGSAEAETPSTGAAPCVVSNPVISAQPVRYKTEEK